MYIYCLREPVSVFKRLHLRRLTYASVNSIEELERFPGQEYRLDLAADKPPLSNLEQNMDT
jgi:hypothetical protein